MKRNFLILFLLVSGMIHPAEVTPKSCGIRSLFRLCDIMGRNLSEDEKERIVRAYPQAECSMLDIKNAASQLGINLIGVQATLEELEQIPGPKILHLKEPEHFITVSRFSPKWVQVIGRWKAYSVPRVEISSRYTGYALILEPKSYTNEDGPYLHLEEFHFDVGEVERGKQIQHTFLISNKGKNDLLISPQSESCGIPYILVEKKVVPPGETTQVTVKYIPLFPGRIELSAKLLTNDPSQPVVFLTISGKVPYEVEVFPKSLELQGGKRHPIRGNVRITLPSDVEIKEVRSEKGLFLINLINLRQETTLDEESEKDNNLQKSSIDAVQLWQLGLSYRGKNLPGKYHDNLFILTTSRNQPLITIPVDIWVQGDLEICPSFVFFGFLKVMQTSSRDLYVHSINGTSFQLKGVRCALPNVSFDVRKISNEKWRITVYLNADRKGIIEGVLEVLTDVPGEEILNIPVYAHILGEEND
ncbi:DUF1573 domain-containing protein [bacterium]|nr:DUF1573 domain-containing protein [bacterium]